jgi:hypothetical protein
MKATTPLVLVQPRNRPHAAEVWPGANPSSIEAAD